jgi:molecular chaperone GrpE
MPIATEAEEQKNKTGSDQPDPTQAQAEPVTADGSVSPKPQHKKSDRKSAKILEQKSAEIVELEKNLTDWQNKAAEYLDGWQRARAEFANYKKRVEREQSQAYQSAAGSILKHHLEVLDDLDRALKSRPKDGDGAAWAGGIELVYRKLITLLESEGVKVMQADGQMFDPNLHEAISSEESACHKSGQIIEVLQKGYFLGDRVLRPALVRVAR